MDFLDSMFKKKQEKFEHQVDPKAMYQQEKNLLKQDLGSLFESRSKTYINAAGSLNPKNVDELFEAREIFKNLKKNVDSECKTATKTTVNRLSSMKPRADPQFETKKYKRICQEPIQEDRANYIGYLHGKNYKNFKQIIEPPLKTKINKKNSKESGGNDELKLSKYMDILSGKYERISNEKYSSANEALKKLKKYEFEFNPLFTNLKYAMYSRMNQEGLNSNFNKKFGQLKLNKSKAGKNLTRQLFGSRFMSNISQATSKYKQENNNYIPLKKEIPTSNPKVKEIIEEKNVQPPPPQQKQEEIEDNSDKFIETPTSEDPN